MPCIDKDLFNESAGAVTMMENFRAYTPFQT